jgi:hypothetical protein
VDLGVVSTDGKTYRLLETVKLFVRQHTDVDEHDRLHAAWCLHHATAVPRTEWLTSIDLLFWVCAHHADLLAAEQRYLAAGDQQAVAALLGAQWSALDVGLGSAKAAGTIARVERYRANEHFDPASQGSLHLAAAFAGRPARRPDWLYTGARRAAELFEESADDAGLAAALIVLSWMTALNDPNRAVDLVDQATAAAQRSGSETLVRFTRVNRSIPLTMGLRFEEAAVELDGVRPLIHLPPADLSMWFFDNYQYINDTCINPGRAASRLPLLYERQMGTFDSADSNLIPFAVGAASAGDIDWTVRLINEAVDHLRNAGIDDGLPDLLVPFAMLAWRLDDHQRARRLLTAVRHAGRPTSNVGTTMPYRYLRNLVGVDRQPPEALDLPRELAAAREWLATIAADHPSTDRHTTITT